MNQQRENVSNTQIPSTQRTSSGLGQSSGNQQRSGAPDMGSERSAQRGSERLNEESEIDRGSSL